jgi:hypothetical protein
LGGFADPHVDLGHVNIFTEDMDLPQIKPRTIQQKNEFYVSVPNEKPALTKEDAQNLVFTDFIKEMLN